MLEARLMQINSTEPRSGHDGPFERQTIRQSRPMLKRFLTGLFVAVMLAGAAAAGPLEDATSAFKRIYSVTELELIRRLAEQGNAFAQSSLGEMYQMGEGVPENLVEAAEWFRLAAEQGHARSQRAIGFMYMEGEGVARDDAEGARWNRMAAEQGDAIAQMNVGFAYKTGRGVPQNDSEAARWYRMAAEQGRVSAQKLLAEWYESGRGVPQDYVLAYMWLSLAATRHGGSKHKGLRERLDRLAARMTSEQIARAQKLIPEMQAATRDQIPTEAQAGVAMLKQIATAISGVTIKTTALDDAELDDTEVFEIMRRLADEGDPAAQVNIGTMYYHGLNRAGFIGGSNS